MLHGEPPIAEMESYRKAFGDFPALLDIRGEVTREELIKRMTMAIEEGKPIPDDDPIYVTFDEGIES